MDGQESQGEGYEASHVRRAMLRYDGILVSNMVKCQLKSALRNVEPYPGYDLDGQLTGELRVHLTNLLLRQADQRALYGYE